MTPYLSWPDFTLWCADARKAGAMLPTGGVDCVVTSPPYFGLRDYGTGWWEGGDPDCDHSAAKRKTRYDYSLASSPIQDGSRRGTDAQPSLFLERCPECGADRVDDQIGLERDSDSYLDQLVAVFEGIQPSLSPHATLWVNLGDKFTDKEPLLIPWRFVFRMKEIGYHFRRDVIWNKPDPMPESVKNRPVTSHEYVLFFSWGEDAYYDWFGVREDATWATDPRYGQRITYNGKHGERAFVSIGTKRSLRSVWTITTETLKEEHYAPYPLKLALRCIEAGCAHSVCSQCGTPRERIVESHPLDRSDLPTNHPEYRPERYDDGKAGSEHSPGPGQRYSEPRQVGWTDCACGSEKRRGVVLDPFMGSGTTALAARLLGRDCIGIELSESNCAMIERRLAQGSLFSEEVTV